MSRRTGVRLVVAAAVCVTVALFWLTTRLPLRPLRPGGELILSNADSEVILPVDETQSCLHTFTVSNPTRDPVTVRAVSGSCGCATCTPDHFEVPPGESISAVLRLDTTRLMAVPTATREIRVTLVPRDQGGGELGRWVFKVTTRPQMFPSVAEIVLAGNSSGYPEKEFYIFSSEHISAVDVAARSPSLKVETKPEGSGRTRVKVSLVGEGMREGTDTTLTYSGRTDKGETVGPHQIAVHVRPPVRIVVTPPTVEFGRVRVGAVLTHTVLIRHSDGLPVRVVGADPVPDLGLSYPASAAAVAPVTMKLKARAVESDRISVTLLIRVGDGEPERAPLTLTYFTTQEAE